MTAFFEIPAAELPILLRIIQPFLKTPLLLVFTD
jgi:hypothetical protein